MLDKLLTKKAKGELTDAEFEVEKVLFHDRVHARVHARVHDAVHDRMHFSFCSRVGTSIGQLEGESEKSNY